MRSGTRGRFGERHDTRAPTVNWLVVLKLEPPGRPIAAHLQGLAAVGERSRWAAAREAADWFDGAGAAAHECGDEAETQKGEKGGEARALSGKAGDGGFADTTPGQGAALGVGRSRRGVSDGTTAALACVLQEMRRGWARCEVGFDRGIEEHTGLRIAEGEMIVLKG